MADGVRLGPQPPSAQGYSIEARLYAEDPARGWQPQAGTLHRFDIPIAHGAFAPLTRPGVRVDSGVVDGSVVSVHYDPMLAKVISFAPSRTQAAALLADALARARVHGVRTNRDLLVNVLRHPAFIAGDTDTAFFDTHDLASLSTPLADCRHRALVRARCGTRRRSPQPRHRNGFGQRAVRLAQPAVGFSGQAIRWRGRRRA